MNLKLVRYVATRAAWKLLCPALHEGSHRYRIVTFSFLWETGELVWHTACTRCNRDGIAEGGYRLFGVGDEGREAVALFWPPECGNPLPQVVQMAGAVTEDYLRRQRGADRHRLGDLVVDVSKQ